VRGLVTMAVVEVVTLQIKPDRMDDYLEGARKGCL
jgi:hypothetical protein